MKFLAPFVACAAALALTARLSAQDYTFEALQAALGNSVEGADFIVSHSAIGDPMQVAVATAETEGFPTEGSSYLVLSNGDAQYNPVENTAYNYGGPEVFDDFYHDDLVDIGGVAVDVALPDKASSLSVDYKYWSWDFAPYFDPFRIYLDTPTGSSLVAQTDGFVEFGLKPDDDNVLTFGALRTLTVDVSAFKGQMVTIRFEASDLHDGSVDSGVLLDNLTVKEKNNEPPVADAGQDLVVDCTSSAGAAVMLDGTQSSDPDGDQLAWLWSAPDGIVFDDETSPTPTAVFPIGVTSVTLTVSDGAETASDTVDITVIDDVAPSVRMEPSVGNLWPPNHRIEVVGVTVEASDECTAPGELELQSVTVTSNELDDSTGDGAFVGDVAGADGFTSPVDVTSAFVWNPATQSFDGDVDLRAERMAGGRGRTYTIYATVTDASGNTSSATTTVVVPHSRPKK